MQIKIRSNHPFFRRINELMRHETQTVCQTSSKIGIRRDLLKAYMDGKAMPTVEKLELIADYFQVSVDYLLGRE